MRLADLVAASEAVASTRSRNRKTELLAEVLGRARGEGGAEGARRAALAVSYLTGSLPQGRIGLGPATLRGAFDGTSPAAAPALTLAEVDAAFSAIAAASGPGSGREKGERLAALLARATGAEQRFLAGLVVGELRQGALEGVMAEAVAKAAGLDGGRVRRAVMLAGDLPAVAAAALGADPGDAAAGLERFGLQIFRPLQPMLAQPADDLEAALGRLGEAALEIKLDGARVQVHKAGDEVRAYSRRLNEVTAAVPELVESVRALPAGELILDGEAIALRPDGTPHPFQVTMRRFGRRLDVAAMRRELPLSTLWFDLLYLDGDELLDRPAADRFAALSALVPAAERVPTLTTGDLGAARGFLDAALARGHEGVMAKALDAAYEAGGRGWSWLKVKPAHTLDLVVLAAEWGSGRRRGWLSNLHLGARDPELGGFVMLGKTFKGLTDALLEWQTTELLAREIGRDRYTVHVRPELVVEIAFNDVQASPRYPGGLALRFARVKRYRSDKTAAEADTVATVREIHRRATGG